jgi:hypothetical protein
VDNSDHSEGVRLDGRDRDGREWAVVGWSQVDDQTKECGGANQPNNAEDETSQSQLFSAFPWPGFSEVLTRCDGKEDRQERAETSDPEQREDEGGDGQSTYVWLVEWWRLRAPDI